MDVSSLVPAGLQPGLDLCVVPAGYNKLSENLRKLTPIAIQCAIFCGGSRCKYENPKAWRPVHMAIQDIFSHWVTDDVLAMARPSTAQLIKKNVIEQFKNWSIKTIVNLQTPGEHASCGGNLEESGFTYEPNHFMKNGIYYYNFAWKDYGDATMSKLLDMVKVVAFAVQEGRVAIHCHAGLGRTGVLIACYLIYSLRVRASDAIRFVRMKRPGAIQTRGQIQCIQEFEHFILPQMIVYPMAANIDKRQPVSLQSYLRRQSNALHGYEQRTFKHIPKIVFVICERILKLCDCHDDNSPADIKFQPGNIPFTRKFIANVLERLHLKGSNMRHSYSWAESLSDSSLDCSASKIGAESNSSRDTSEDIRRLEDVFCASPESPSCSTSYPALDDTFVDEVLGDGITGQEIYENGCYKEIQSQLNLKVAARKNHCDVLNVEEAIKALLCDHETLPEESKKRLQKYQVDLNNKSSTWQRLDMERDLRVLSGLLFDWLETLKRPVLDVDALSQIVIRGSKPRHCLQKLEASNRYLLEYLLRFVSRLRPMTMDMQALIIKRITASLTHQRVWIKNTLLPSGKDDFQKLRNGTAGKIRDFFTLLMSLIEEINTQDLDESWPRSRWEVAHRLRELEVTAEKE
ncbi:protein tyrosine phosphatase domain-containing protein 1-like isoform X2 [Venturia canescens]|uniref:protein tyrosine phosphatase domain-containing protein 1-like isoform X2 n=1 Tax=Venturia canescens TaxID=32260 RepID=UPI001C9CEEC5|nr:protein tyrosine phosphatase domain-containing protein 1-like isoform X2 [Venturia canescens]